MSLRPRRWRPWRTGTPSPRPPISDGGLQAAFAGEQAPGAQPFSFPFTATEAPTWEEPTRAATASSPFGLASHLVRPSPLQQSADEAMNSVCRGDGGGGRKDQISHTKK